MRRFEEKAKEQDLEDQLYEEALNNWQSKSQHPVPKKDEPADEYLERYSNIRKQYLQSLYTSRVIDSLISPSDRFTPALQRSITPFQSGQNRKDYTHDQLKSRYPDKLQEQGFQQVAQRLTINPADPELAGNKIYSFIDDYITQNSSEFAPYQERVVQAARSAMLPPNRPTSQQASVFGSESGLSEIESRSALGHKAASPTAASSLNWMHPFSPFSDSYAQSDTGSHGVPNTAIQNPQLYGSPDNTRNLDTGSESGSMMSSSQNFNFFHQTGSNAGLGLNAFSYNPHIDEHRNPTPQWLGQRASESWHSTDNFPIDPNSGFHQTRHSTGQGGGYYAQSPTRFSTPIDENQFQAHHQPNLNTSHTAQSPAWLNDPMQVDLTALASSSGSHQRSRPSNSERPPTSPQNTFAAQSSNDMFSNSIEVSSLEHYQNTEALQHQELSATAVNSTSKKRTREIHEDNVRKYEQMISELEQHESPNSGQLEEINELKAKLKRTKNNISRLDATERKKARISELKTINPSLEVYRMKLSQFKTALGLTLDTEDIGSIPLKTKYKQSQHDKHQAIIDEVNKISKPVQEDISRKKRARNNIASLKSQYTTDVELETLENTHSALKQIRRSYFRLKRENPSRVSSPIQSDVESAAPSPVPSSHDADLAPASKRTKQIPASHVYKDNYVAWAIQQDASIYNNRPKLLNRYKQINPDIQLESTATHHWIYKDGNSWVKGDKPRPAKGEKNIPT